MKQINKYIIPYIFYLLAIHTPFTANATGETTHVYHTVVITAPSVYREKVTLKALKIINGSATGASTKVTSNGKEYYRTQGGGMNISGATVELTDCEISNNTATTAAGIYIANRSDVSFNRCSIEQNIGNGNTGGILTTGNSIIRMVDSNVSSNVATTGIAAGMQIQTSKSYIFNSTFSGNKSGSNVGGCYLREGSENYWVNCTVYGNEAIGYGGGMTIYGTSASPAKTYLISSTISGNEATSMGGGINITNAYGTLDLQNSIVSGNTGTNELNGTYNKYYSIVGNKVYNASGVEISGKVFDPDMLDTLKDNGGYTPTCLLLKDNNPAFSCGMNTDQLTTLSRSFAIPIPENIIANDQIGNSRLENNIIGPVAKKCNTNQINKLQQEEYPVKVINHILYVKAFPGENIAIYTVSGQLSGKVQSAGEWLPILNLSKGIYIIKIANKSYKVII